MTPPGLLIAAPRSGSGKTTLTLGLLRALRRAGTAVASAKCGPDYIDPPFHRAASGRPSVNLDSWAMPPALLHALAAQVGTNAELILCEALMGLFDGVPGPTGRTGSSADIAAALGWPVLLVLDVSGQSQSAAAIVHGCATYDPRITIAGVVLNRIGSPRHARLATEAIEALNIPVVGILPRSDAITLPERHLGLIQATETPELDTRLDHIGEFITRHVNIAAIQALAANTQPTPHYAQSVPPPGQRVAIAWDAAFSFLYPHILQGWLSAGAELRFFSPLANQPPDNDCDAVWLPGGYPELHAATLSNARGFLTGVRHVAETRPVHGECGGYMVLGTTLTDATGTTYPMAGLLDVATSFARRKLHLGYRIARLIDDGPLGPAGTTLRGHEFHYASIESQGEDIPFARVSDAYGSAPTPAGSRRGHTTGSFFHVIAAEP